MEYAYSEQVKVVDGLCEVQHSATRDYLFKMGYEELEVEEASVTPSENESDGVDQSVAPSTRAKSKAKHRRSRK